MGPEGSLLRSQELPTSPHPETDNPDHNTSSYLSKIHFNIIIAPVPISFYDIFSSGFPTKIQKAFFFL
jgi:hypothetical protein